MLKIVELTKEEQHQIYSKLSKEEIIDMLINANNVINLLLEMNNNNKTKYNKNNF